MVHGMYLTITIYLYSDKFLGLQNIFKASNVLIVGLILNTCIPVVQESSDRISKLLQIMRALTAFLNFCKS